MHEKHIENACIIHIEQAAPLFFLWVVWHERNRVAFDNETFPTHRMKRSFICNLWSWSNVQ